MKKVRLALSKSKPTDTAQFAEGIVQSLTGNANVPAPDPALSVLTDGAQAIRDKMTEIAGTETLLETQQSQLVTLNEALKMDLRMLADHVEDKCNGNEEKLRSTGFRITGDPQPARTEIGQVQNLRVDTTTVDGELRARWKKVPGAVSYVLDRALAADGPWTENVATSTRVEHTFEGLTPGQKYWFRVRAFGSPGFGGYSDPACKMAA